LGLPRLRLWPFRGLVPLPRSLLSQLSRAILR